MSRDSFASEGIVDGHNGTVRIVMTRSERANVRLDYCGPAACIYAGFDRFGRVIDQKWVMGSTVKDQYQYQYDALGSRTYRQNALHTAFGGVQVPDKVKGARS